MGQSFSYYKNMENFEAFRLNILLSANLYFMKSNVGKIKTGEGVEEATVGTTGVFFNLISHIELFILVIFCVQLTYFFLPPIFMVAKCGVFFFTNGISDFRLLIKRFLYKQKTSHHITVFFFKNAFLNVATFS